MRKLFFVLVTLSALFLGGCKKSSEELATTPLSDYYPLQVGKYVTYKLDSTIFINFGTQQTIHSYQVKHVVDAQITDNLGRPAYRIIRYIRNTSTDPWVPDNTFMAVPTEFAVEFIENNLRYVKVKAPMRDSYSWKGNSYIDTYSANSDLKYLDSWDYTYDSLFVPATIGTIHLDSTIKISQRDEQIGGDPTQAATLYAERNLGEEKYGKGIGLVFRNFLHWEYQNISGRRFYVGYGVKLTMIDHN